MAFERALDLLLYRRRAIIDHGADYGPLASLEKTELEQIEAALAHLGWKPLRGESFTGTCPTCGQRYHGDA